MRTHSSSKLGARLLLAGLPFWLVACSSGEDANAPSSSGGTSGRPTGAGASPSSSGSSSHGGSSTSSGGAPLTSGGASVSTGGSATGAGGTSGATNTSG